MTDNDLDRTLASWFEGDALAAPPADGFQRAIAGARRRKARPAWLAGAGSHWGWETAHDGSSAGVLALPGTRVRWSLAVTLLLLIGALVAGAVLVGARLLESPPPPLTRLDQVAFARDGDVFLADEDGRNPVRIADGLPGGKSGCGRAGYGAEGPMWSPDGRFFTYRSGRNQVQCERPEADTFPTVEVSDSNGHVVASVPGVGWQVAWSPDSTRFATWLNFSSAWSIGVYGPDGTRQALVSVPSINIGEDVDPVWSPDGGSLLLPEGGDIWELPIDGRPARRLPTDDFRINAPITPSPDGTRIAYTRGNRLVVADADGSRPRPLGTAIEGSWSHVPYVWSPRGDQIAGAWSRGLRIIDLASGSMTMLVPAESSGELSVIAFSSDGERILFSRDGGLWSVGSDGSNERLLVSGTEIGDW